MPERRVRLAQNMQYLAVCGWGIRFGRDCMFRKKSKQKKQDAPPPPDGVSEIVFCVFDEKQHVHHEYHSKCADVEERDFFRLLNDPHRAFDNCVLAEAVATRRPASLAFSYGEGRMKYLFVLPYERKWGNWRYACMQVAADAPNPDSAKQPYQAALFEDRVCLLLVDAHGAIKSAGSKVPEAFGYTPDVLAGMALSDLFARADLGVIESCSADTNQSILSCVFHCLDGSRRDVEVKKYSAADHLCLYAVCDVTRPQFNEEVTQVSTRERRRIGQDLHDSIGQLLTGISLLSRSLANSLARGGNPGSEDAAQISELADDASNQIRQISRGLMPSEIVQRGLFASLQELAKVTTDSCGIHCEALMDDTVEFADGAVETHLFRIAQEAVNNAVRHAGASRIDIVVSKMNGMPQLEICDNGSWKESPENSGGIGMKTMEYRASAINGHLNVGAMAQGGTQVVCLLEMEELFETKA